MLTSRNILNNGYYIGERQKFTGDDRLCLPVPLFHCFGCVLGGIGAGGRTLGPLSLLGFSVRRRARGERRLVLHLLNYAGAPASALRVRLQEPAVSATLHSPTSTVLGNCRSAAVRSTSPSSASIISSRSPSGNSHKHQSSQVSTV